MVHNGVKGVCNGDSVTARSNGVTAVLSMAVMVLCSNFVRHFPLRKCNSFYYNGRQCKFGVRQFVSIMELNTIFFQVEDFSHNDL